MKVIYHCYGGSHSSITAAGIHLGFLPNDRLPSREMFMKIPYFDGQTNKDHGQLRFMGTDDDGHEVYILGRRNAKQAVENSFTDIAELYGFNKDIYMVDLMPYVNWYMVIGGITSRKFGLIRLGRPIVLRGSQHAFFKIASVVEETKMKIGGLV